MVADITGETVYERIALVLETNCIRQPTAQFVLQPQYTENPHNICASLTCLQVLHCKKVSVILTIVSSPQLQSVCVCDT